MQNQRVKNTFPPGAQVGQAGACKAQPQKCVLRAAGVRRAGPYTAIAKLHLRPRRAILLSSEAALEANALPIIPRRSRRTRLRNGTVLSARCETRERRDEGDERKR